MKVNVPKEKNDFERRVAITPEVAQSLIKAGFEVNIEKDAGLNSYFDNAAYEKAGAKIVDDPNAIYRDADVILKVNAPTPAEIGQMKKDSILISMMYASTNQAIVEACQSAGISAFSMDAIPRISRAQKMDVLSSQANLAGYKAVMIGAAALGKIFPLLMTAAGTIKPSKVVIDRKSVV